MQGNYPEESIQHSEHGESLKSRILSIFLKNGMHCSVLSGKKISEFVLDRKVSWQTKNILQKKK
jgi:hypothetical protein